MIRLLMYIFLSIATVFLFLSPDGSEASTRISSKANYFKSKKAFNRASPQQQFVIARYAILYDDTRFARRALFQLKDKKGLPADEISMMIARAYFQDKNFDAAVKWYNQVPKNSDFWLESQEEKAWSLYRLNRIDELKANLETLLSPVFSDLVFSEMYYLAALADLRSCDYQAVLKITKKMKEDYMDRVQSLEKISRNKSVSESVLNNLQQSKFSYLTFGTELKSNPLYFYRDEELKKARKNPEKIRRILVEKSKKELKSISKDIKRLHLVEAEVMQRVYNNDDSFNKNDLQIASSADILVFPKNSDEVWVDEIENFQASVKSCNQKRKAL